MKEARVVLELQEEGLVTKVEMASRPKDKKRDSPTSLGRLLGYAIYSSGLDFRSVLKEALEVAEDMEAGS